MKTRIAVLAGAAILASAAPRVVHSQAVPDKPTTPADSTKDIDPVGTYTIYLTAQGNALTAVTKIEKLTDGSYGGTVTGDGIPPLPVTAVKVAKNKVTVTLTAPDGNAATIEMDVTGNDVTGKWSMPGDGSAITGTKSP